VANLSVAASRKYTNGDGQEVSETIWFKVSVRGKMAEACKSFLKKGGQVYIEGRLIVDPDTGGPRLWTRQDGRPAASFELHADLVRFLGGKNGEANGQVEQSAGVAAESEIPF
jgi:single-strand DNA-binding protein